jgi:hypothetical protein
VARYREAVQHAGHVPSAIAAVGLFQWGRDDQLQGGRAILCRVEASGRIMHNDDRHHARDSAERLLTPANTLSVEYMRVIGPVIALDAAVAYGLRESWGLPVDTVPTFDRAVDRALVTLNPVIARRLTGDQQFCRSRQELG